MKNRRLLSGIRASGDLHLGNYLGAIRGWVETQGEEVDPFYFVADLHGLTSLRGAHVGADYADQRLRTAAGLLACGVDPTRSTLFLQSAVRQHAEILWFMAAIGRHGELRRMAQWKDAENKGSSGQLSAALLVYPVLMAGDILLYDADEVPVGDDQRQHVEMARVWARRFNTTVGDSVFKVPSATVPAAGSRVMDLRDPAEKMSKSATSSDGVVFLDESPEEISRKLMRAQTDAGTEVIPGQAGPGVQNLVDLLASTTGSEAAGLFEAYAGSGYGKLKRDVADSVIEVLAPVRERLGDLLDDRAEIRRQLNIGAERAGLVAEKTCSRARESLGLGPI
ncbi:MAG: tryptophan--tRNA ligase [bacterium]|nr:tryptophan--tRNA ligase [bacterium]